MTNADEMTKNGRALFQSADNIRRSSLDLNVMMTSIWEMLENRTVDIGEIEKGDEDNTGDNLWTYTAKSQTGFVRLGDKRKRPIATFTYTVRLCGTEALSESDTVWPWLDQACLIMAWCKNQDFRWGPADYEPSNTESLTYLRNGLWAWAVDEGELHDSFFFVLPLFALSTEDDLKKMVLKPFKMLFEVAEPSAEDINLAFDQVPVLKQSTG